MKEYPEFNKEYPEFNKEWIGSPITLETSRWTEDFGKYLCAYEEDKQGKALTTGQLRKFFGEVKRIETAGVQKCKDDLVMLKPLLAYAVGRAKKENRIKEFSEEITNAIDAVLEGEDIEGGFRNFVKILEAIVAYHKRYGGQD